MTISPNTYVLTDVEVMNVVLALAKRWGVIQIPNKLTVEFRNYRFVDGIPAGQEGISTMSPVDETHPGWPAFVACTFAWKSGDPFVAAANLIDWQAREIARLTRERDGRG